MNLFRFFRQLCARNHAALEPTFAARACIIRMGVGKRTSHFPLVEMQHKGERDAERERDRESARIIAPAARLPIHSPAIIFHNALAICIFIYSTCAGRSSASAPSPTSFHTLRRTAVKNDECFLCLPNVSNQSRNCSKYLLNIGYFCRGKI